MTFEATVSATSSPASAAGHTPSASPDGPTTDPSSRALPLASPSARLASEPEQMTLGICGPSSSGSSASADLSSLLANKLRARLGTAGSMEYRQTWKEKGTPSGRSYWAHTASAHRISGSDCGSSPIGWPTPDAQAMNVGCDPEKHLSRLERLKEKHGNGNGAGLTLGAAASMAGWPTPNVPNGGRSIAHAEMKGATAYHKGKKVQMGLEAVAKMAGWPTPGSTDGDNAPTKHYGRSLALNGAAKLAGWSTPTSVDGRRGSLPPRLHDTGHPLDQQAAMAGWGWATPRQSDGKRASRSREGALKEAARKGGNNDLGTTAGLSLAPTENRGALNPAFSLWLQGYPMQWMDSAPSRASVSSVARETRSSPRSRPSSSKRRGT